jgi:NAD(P)-dependent dehydrogenase (short-subunit alcohol dehydrogenase family)
VWSNVGVQTAGTVLQASVADLDRCYAANLRSHFVVVQRALPALCDAGGGPFLITASNAGLVSDTQLVTNSAIKAAAVALARLLARDHAAERIRVNALCPGYVDTPFNGPIWEKFAAATRSSPRPGSRSRWDACPARGCRPARAPSCSPMTHRS